MFIGKTFSTLILVSTFTCLTALTCEKEDKVDDGPKLTASVLMGNSGKAWYISKINSTYYSASGAVDSTSTFSQTALDQVMWFGDNGGVGGLNETYYAMPPLDAYVPSLGTWSLNVAGQVLTLNCYGLGCGNNTDGNWKVTHYSERNAYGESVTFERTFSLPNNRKVVREFKLFKD